MSVRTATDRETVLALRPCRSEHAVCEPVDGAAVALHLGTGEYYELCAAGWSIWMQCDGRRSGREMAAKLAEAYGIPEPAAEADTARFLGELLDAGLVAPDGSVPA